MKKEYLNNLLTDLYTFYNKDYLQFVDSLTEKYHRMEHSVVEMILLKYNHKNNPKCYNPEMIGDDYIHSIVKEYSNGNRPLQNLETIEKIEVQDEKIQISEKVNELSKDVNDKISNSEKELKKELETYKKTLEEIIKKKENISHFDAVDIKINLFYTESEIILPNKEILASLGIGSRIIVMNKENKPIGLEVKDITYDCASNIMFEGKPTLEITLDKA